MGLLLLGPPYQEVLGHSHMKLWLSEDELKAGALFPLPCECWGRDTEISQQITGWFLGVEYCLGQPLDGNGRAVGLRERGGADSREHQGLWGQTGQDTAHLAWGSLDLLVDGFQLLLKHDGQCLHVSLPTGGQQLSPEHPLGLLLI